MQITRFSLLASRFSLLASRFSLLACSGSRPARLLAALLSPCAPAVALAQPEPNYAREQEIAQMGEVTPNVAADFDPVLGTPTFIRSTTAYLTRRSTRTPAQVVADFVNDNPATFGVSLGGGALTGAAQFPEAEFRVIRDFVTPTLGPTGVRHLTYQQQHNGQDIYGSILTANVTGDGMLVNISSRFVAAPAGAAAITPPTCGARNAVAAACDEMDDARIADITNLIDPGDDCTTDWTVGHAYHGVGETALLVRSVLCSLPGEGVVQAWWVRLPANPDAEDASWECVIRHTDLSLLTVGDMTMRCQPDPVSFFVHKDVSPVPGIPGLDTFPETASIDTECEIRALLDDISDCGTALNDSRAWLVITAADVQPWSPNGWLNERFDEPGTVYSICQSTNPSITCGNNVRVRITEHTAPIPGPGRQFGLGHDHRSAESAATLAFVTANEWHDRMTLLGFNEEAGNYQHINFTGLGQAADALDVRVNPGGLSNSATNNYPAGVEDGRQTIIAFNAYSTTYDGLRYVVHDRTALYHELTHAMSVRLHPGTPFMATGSLGDFDQTLALWEGWCDAMAILLATDPTDNPDVNYPVFTWPGRYRGGLAAGVTQHYYFGGNMFYPYTPNKNAFNPTIRKATNPLTYGHIDPGTGGGPPPKPLPTYAEAPFNPIRDSVATLPPANPPPTRVPQTVRTNKYFAGSIWCTAIIDARAELAHDVGMAEANAVMLQLAVDAMKLDPGTPNFPQSRDSILQADLARFGGIHYAALMRGFARRGLGVDAACSGSAAVGVQESFEPPPDKVAVFFPEGVPYTIDTCEESTIEVLAVGMHSPITHLRGAATPNPQSIGLTGQDATPGDQPGMYLISLTPAPCRQAWTFWVEATTETSSQFQVCSDPTEFMAGEESVAFFDDMEAGTNEWATAMVPPVSGNTYADEGRWERVYPDGGFAMPARDVTPGAGQQCWVTDNRRNVFFPNSFQDVDSPGDGVYLTSPTLPVWSNTKVLVELSLWYASQDGEPTDAECVIEWVRQGDDPVPIIGPLSPVNSAKVWRRVRGTVDTGVLNGVFPSLRIRFIDSPPDSIVEGGVDDVRISMIFHCRDCCDGDMNMDGNVDQDDVTYLQNVINGGGNPAGTDPDFNHDGNADYNDVVALINYIGGAGCP
jgi:hypothetical protein